MRNGREKNEGNGLLEKEDDLASSGGGRGSLAEEEGRERRGYGKRIKRGRMTRLRRRWNEEDGIKMLQEEGRDPRAGWTRK